ncbi:kinase-like protein [Wilcoxina mikolae CBS 423.85]|nr:kinase-like protein [Wilcoxina mikolae CBS 423.85]
MFSTLVSHSNGMFTRYSASTNRYNGDLQWDLIAFLAVVQKCNVGFHPIAWQPALDILGKGGSGTISQSTFTTDMPLAFKRFHEGGDSGSGDSGMDFLPLISEVLILSQPPIQEHPNIINLEGVCWEIKRRTEKAIPVLIFEKASWDLQQFMSVSEGKNMSIDDRLKICADIGSAILTLHAYDVIHGDIKPQNVLVFKDATGKTTVKVADFGYSTLAASEDLAPSATARVFLPKSRPWNAPEHHFGEFTATGAKMTDVYSFGLLCLWVLFGSAHTECMSKGISFDPSTGPRTRLEQLKDDDELETIANQLIDSMPLANFSVEHRTRLKDFFSLTVRLNHENRSSDMRTLVGLLSQERVEFQPITLTPFRTNMKAPIHGDFRIAENLEEFMAADYRVRIQIKQSLENNYSKNRDQPIAVNIAFQVAFCYLIGFGVKSNDIQCRIWLESSMRKPDQLEIEKEAVQPARWKNERMRELNGIVHVDLNHEYRVSGFNKLEEACKAYEREVSDMAREFGELHFISLTSMNNLASTYSNQGRSKEAEELEVQVMETRKRVMETRKRVLGQEHPDTLTSMNNLASTYMRQGRWKEAEELQIEAVNRLRKTLGDDHPNTVRAIANLASFREERTTPQHIMSPNEPMEVLRDILLQFAASWTLDEGNADRERLQHTFKMLQKDATEDDDPMTDEERLQLALAVSREVDDNNDTNEERLRRALAMLIEVDEDNETNEERLQRALAMSMEDKNDNDEIGSLKREYSPDTNNCEPPAANRLKGKEIQRHKY